MVFKKTSKPNYNKHSPKTISVLDRGHLRQQFYCLSRKLQIDPLQIHVIQMIVLP